MAAARIRYVYNESPRRWVAALGVLLLKIPLLLPHAIILAVLETATGVVLYAGWWWTLLTGRVPGFVSSTVTVTAGWWVRMRAWFAGVTDVYPPMEFTPPADYLPALDISSTDSPNRILAAAGVLGLKVVAILPLFVLAVLIELGLVVVAWISSAAALVSGRVPRSLQDFCIGTGQWGTRLLAWLAGMDNAYPLPNIGVHPITGGESPAATITVE